MRSPLLLLLCASCVAPRPYNRDEVEQIIEVPEGVTEIAFEVVLDIRDGAMPDPSVYDGDWLDVETDLRGAYTLEVQLDGRTRPRKAQETRRSAYTLFQDVARDCPPQGCVHVARFDLTRERVEPDELYVGAWWDLWTIQAGITFFPSAATEQEIRLRVFEL